MKNKVLTINTSGTKDYTEDLVLDEALTVKELIEILKQEPENQKVIMSFNNGMISTCLTRNNLKTELI